MYIHVHVHCGYTFVSTQALNIAAHEEDIYDVVTGLKQKTYYGRPNWDQEFSNLAREHEGSVQSSFMHRSLLSFFRSLSSIMFGYMLCQLVVFASVKCACL